MRQLVEIPVRTGRAGRRGLVLVRSVIQPEACMPSIETCRKRARNCCAGIATATTPSGRRRVCGVRWPPLPRPVRRAEPVTRELEVANRIDRVEMLERSYSFVIEDLEDEGPRPAESERLCARQLALSGDQHRKLRIAGGE